MPDKERPYIAPALRLLERVTYIAILRFEYLDQKRLKRLESGASSGEDEDWSSLEEDVVREYVGNMYKSVPEEVIDAAVAIAKPSYEMGKANAAGNHALAAYWFSQVRKAKGA